MFKAVIVYTIVDDILKDIGHNGDKRQKMTDSEVITTAILAHLMFGGNIDQARRTLSSPRYIPDMLSKSRLSRRIQALDELINRLLQLIARLVKLDNSSKEYIIDSFPVSICHNIRISRCRLLKGEQYRGKCVRQT